MKTVFSTSFYYFLKDLKNHFIRMNKIKLLRKVISYIEIT